jgi:cytochrome P450
VNPKFTPKAINSLDSRIRQYASEYVSAIAPRGSCEFMSEFAFEFPIKVFLELMGLPQSETKVFLKWVGDLLHSQHIDVLVKATHEVVAYLRGVIEERKHRPADDLVSFGVQAEMDGRKLDDDELLGFCFNLFVGGLDTVSSNMGLHFWHLARYPDDQRRLRQQPELIAPAIDEFMRAYANVMTFRTCKKQTQIKGVTFMPGDKIAMSTTLAGRDPDEYERANEVLLERKPRHLSFAYGPHLCVGMHLARREMKIALEEFLRLIPPFSIAPHAEIEFLLHGVIQPIQLPLQWEVRP